MDREVKELVSGHKMSKRVAETGPQPRQVAPECAAHGAVLPQMSEESGEAEELSESTGSRPARPRPSRQAVALPLFLEWLCCHLTTASPAG